MVHAGVFPKVAISGIQPCSSMGVSTIPVQNIAWLWDAYSWGIKRHARIKLRM